MTVLITDNLMAFISAYLRYTDLFLFRFISANRLQEGEVTDQKCRELIIRDLNDIKTKFDGLACKDLINSISFLRDGLCLLNFAIEKVTDNEQAKEKEDNFQ